jgi:hypothetical protein
MIRSLLFFFLSGPFWIFGQSALFLPFGQNTQEVYDHFASREYYRVAPEPSVRTQDTLINQMGRGWIVTYLMEDGRLYAVEDERCYEDKKEADLVIEACLSYLNLFEKRVRTIRKANVKSYYVVVLEDRVVELKVWESGKRKKRITNISLRSTSRMYGPRLKTESMITQLDI